ncbi:uncharacterized protein LOC114249627 [Bombyx mandarina]|uniref:Uncharacterized protein LOC114249627 n=1 Tax=Bombyx mandarina TaxID=7092 RepID=A0A6J2KFR1_BOMMA|nr:uncharacterized protein LOC114249627 [Bombyx mandarina]
MSPPDIERVFAVTLTLLMILDSTVYGFSLHRPRDRSEQLPAVDLIADESTLLEVKNELKRPNDIKSFERNKEGGNSEKNIAVEKVKGNFEKLPTSDHLREIFNASKENTTTTLVHDELLTRYNEHYPPLSPTTNSSTTPVQFTEVRHNHNMVTLKSTEHALTAPINESRSASEIISTTNSSDFYDVTTAVQESHDTTTLASLTNAFTVSKDLIQDINELSSTVDMQPFTSDYVLTNDAPNVEDTTFFLNKADEHITFNDETKLPSTARPTKDYVTIVTHKVPSSALTSDGSISISKQNREGNNIKLGAVLIEIPTVSTERLKDLVLSTNEKSKNESHSSYEIITGISSIKPETRVGMVSSMRAGYLDYSGKTAVPQSTTTEHLHDKLEFVEDQPKETENKNISLTESVGQMSEDLINEQLLKEEVIKDNAENADRNHDIPSPHEGVKPLAAQASTTMDTPRNETNKEQANEDLNIQPIIHEPIKNADLYTVSPNYKPMKRLEVQPAKPFVRDPDDNSWRNESISSLGIVFKPKNASKSFTQVLRNKTETILNSLGERDSKGGIPDLRERLEKIAEVRKSKKKRINKFGDTVYSDYEEKDNSNEAGNKSKIQISNGPTSTPSTTMQKPDEKRNFNVDVNPHQGTVDSNTDKPKTYNVAEYYDTTDEYDAEYLTLTKMDIKKHPHPVKETYTSTPVTFTSGYYFPDRRPTIQFFPPRVAPTTNDHNVFHSKVNSLTVKDTESDGPSRTLLATPEAKKESVIKPTGFPRYKAENFNTNLYLTESGPVPQQHAEFDGSDGHFNRASYVVKHYGDFINEAARGDDDRQDYAMLTEAPVRGVTAHELAKLTTDKRQPPSLDDDYDSQFRRDVLNRFVANFNQNSERFKVDFPVIYNSSVVHKKIEDNSKVLASSTAFMKRLYNDIAATKPDSVLENKPCDPHCENVTVELSPAYELHYYVPDEEEKQPVEAKPSAVPYRFRI